MDRDAERKALAEVQARLEQRFPQLHPDIVSAAVTVAHQSLDGPVRDFVPVLVEHAARDRLAFAAADPEAPDTPSTAGPDGAAGPPGSRDA